MKRAFTLLELVIVVAIILVLAAILFPIFARSRSDHRPSCQSSLKQIGLGFFQYAQDYNEILPPARASSSAGWVDLLQPYVKSIQLFQCPQGQSPATTPTSDYFYNRRLSGVAQGSLPQVAMTIMGGDGDDNAPPWNSWAQMPADAATNPNSPCQRHLGMGNYLYADGHVKAHYPTAISSTFASPTSRPTFAIR